MFKFIIKKETWLPILILVVLGGFIYSFNLKNGLFWDDDDWIINNSFVHAVSLDNAKFWLTHNTLAGVGLKSNYYRPFLFFTFALNYILAGIKPLIYHLTSNVVHIFNAILIFWLISRIFKRKLLAFFTALFFLIHPLQTEAITYISGRGDALVAMFMLLALILFYQSESSISSNNIGSVNSGHFKTALRGWLNGKKILSAVFLIFGLLSRETGIIFPLLALALYITALSNENFLRSIKIGLIKTWPYFAVVFIYGILRLTVLNFLNVLNFYVEPNIYSENLHVRMFTFLPVLWGYLKLLIAPVGLHMERSSVVHTSLFQWPVWPVFLALLGLVGWLVFLYKKEKNSFRIWFLGASLFFIGLAPVSGITPINAVMYEHWLYLPMAGFWLISSFYLVKFFDYIKTAVKPLLAVCILLLGAYISFYAVQGIRRNLLWGNQEKFYQDILKYEPGSVRINNNLGNLYFGQKNIEKAEEYYRRAIEAGDIFPQPHFNIGGILQSRGDIFGAIKEYEKAVEIDPNFFYPYQNLAVIYAQQGNLPKARENIEILKSLLPSNPRVFYNSALIYISLNDREQALTDLNEGLKHSNRDPESGKLIEDLIVKLQKQQR